MSYQLHQTEGIVLGRWPRGEADAVLYVYTRDYGGILLFAKGIRLEKSKLRGAVDRCSRSHIGFIAGKETYRLTHAELYDAHVRLQNDIMRCRVASYVVDMFRGSVADGEADPALWLLLTETLSFFSGEEFWKEKASLYLRLFEIKFLKRLGYIPEAMPQVVQTALSFPFAAAARLLSVENTDELSVFMRPLLQYAMTRNPLTG